MPASLTDEQRAAIECRKHSVALSAGAGCGKTFVLTERFISHLDAEADGGKQARLHQLIAITFTDAAAREMRSRIRQACFDRLQQADTVQSQQVWLDHLREIDTARISTIHAFCTSLLRAHAAEAGLDPTFGVLDQADADVLQYDVIEDALRQMLANLDPGVLDLAAAYGLEVLKQQVAELLAHRHEPAFSKWLDANTEELVAAWRSWHKAHALPNAIREIVSEAPVDALVRQLDELNVPAGNKKLGDARAALVDLLPRLARGDAGLKESHLDQIRELAKVHGVCSAKDWSGGGYDIYRDACKALRDVIDKHRPKPFDDVAAGETAKLGMELLKLTAKVAQAYEGRKRALGKLDFDDLLAKAYALLSDPARGDLASRLAKDLRLLLVDEFQDTDRLQVDLVKTICGARIDDGRLFFVGDFKQSIYRFRGAAPHVFRDLREQVKAVGRLPLTLNFRSQPEILHFVNALFCDTFSDDSGRFEHLRADRKQTTKPPAVEFLWTSAPEKNNRRLPGAALEARRAEAKAIARRIRNLLESDNEAPIVDKNSGKARRLEPGDVAILFRTLGDVQVYEEALREYGLDYYLVGGYAFYAQQEIFDVLNLLRAVASPADELSLAGALRSPLFALDDETLFWLVDSTGSMNAGLLADRPPRQLSRIEAAKVSAAAKTIVHLRSIKDRVPIAELLNEAIDRTGYDAVLLAEFLGERKLANLEKLLERARLADESGAVDLNGFITQLAQFVAREPKESIAATLPEDANVIRLMTIHHAKGLEFPLVIVPDLDRLPLLRPPVAAIHPELGPLVRRPAQDEDDEKACVGMDLFAALERREELEERNRMLYVACTRAADYLILSSSLEDFSKPKSDWMNLLGQRFNLATGEAVTQLPVGYAAPKIRVTTEPTTDYKPAADSRGPDLLKLLDKVYERSGNAAGTMPIEISPITVDCTAQRQFSFSRFTGRLIQARSESAEDTNALVAPSSAGGFSTHSMNPETPGKAGLNVAVGSSRVDLQACKLEYSIVSPK